MTEHKRVELIEEYLKIGNDYQWHDNHGELIRCENCKCAELHEMEWYCTKHNTFVYSDDYCSRAERKADERID